MLFCHVGVLKRLFFIIFFYALFALFLLIDAAYLLAQMQFASELIPLLAQVFLWFTWN